MNTVTISAIGVVCLYYVTAWILVGRDPQPGPLVTLYTPPRGLSPAMLRYTWKEKFDERTFWAGILSLVSKGLATLESQDGVALLRATKSRDPQPELPDEEQLLFAGLVKGHFRKGFRVTMLDGHVIIAIENMAATLRRIAVGKWFRENREYISTGVLLSAASIVVAAAPRWMDDWMVLAFSLAIMAPSGFYLCFLTLRVRDLYRAACKRLEAAVVRRALALGAFILCCLATLTVGSVELGLNFGWPVLATTGFLAALNLTFLRWLKAPTLEGRRLLDEIEGFRVFLQSVELHTMDRTEGPQTEAGMYERYLPYAVALEVEHAWIDRFVALSSTHHQDTGMPGAETFFLGIWNDKPVEIVYKPEPPKRY